ncbi:hypothetical protein Tco_0866293 [Tanacetum coccineum]
MDDPNITREEYIRLEKEKARRSVETEFPTIVFKDTLTSEATLSFEPTVSSLNDEIDFRISFGESDDEDCTPTISYIDDLDYFKDFENEFPAIVYNDAPTSKSDFLAEPILNPQHIDEFNLKDETSLSEYDEEEQNVICFNALFPFNVIYPDELKMDTDNDNDKSILNTLRRICINTAYPGEWIRRIDFLYSFRPIRRIHQGRYGVSVPALTKDHKGIKLNTPYLEDQYAVLEIWNEYNILEDIKRGPYSKKSPIRRIQSLDTPYRTDFQTTIYIDDPKLSFRHASESLNHQVDQETIKGA